MNRYEFALLRYVHDVSAEEFVNVGVLFYDAVDRRLLVKINDRYRRLTEFFNDFSGPAYRAMLRQVERALLTVDGELRQPDAFVAAGQTLSALLRRAIPEEESSFAVSRVMSGVTDTPDVRLAELYDEFVLRHEKREARSRVDDAEFRRDISHRIVRAGLTDRVKFDYTIQGANYSWHFTAGWKNGRPQVLEPISLDMADAHNIVEKATHWGGRLLSLSQGAEFFFTAVVAPPAEPTLGKAFDKALAILRAAPQVRDVFPAGSVERALDFIRADTDTSQGQG